MSARRFVTLTSYAAQRLTHTPSVLQESSAALHRNATLAVPEKISAYTIMHTHAYTYVHALVHACMRTHAHIHACMYRCTTSEPSPSPRRTSSSYAWSTRRVAHSPPCSVRGALPPACMYARVWMLSAWSAAPCMYVRTCMDAQCVERCPLHVCTHAYGCSVCGLHCTCRPPSQGPPTATGRGRQHVGRSDCFRRQLHALTPNAPQGPEHAQRLLHSIGPRESG